MAEATKIAWCDVEIQSRHGPKPHPPRAGDKKQARQRVNVLVRTGKIPHPNKVPCSICGHVHSGGERRHEYHHVFGYAEEHHYHVQSMCTICHAKNDGENSKKTHCIRGHEFTKENTYYAKNGTRHCVACKKIYEKNRPPRGSEYWQKVNAKRRLKNGRKLQDQMV